MPDTLATSTDTDSTGPPSVTEGPESAGLISVAQMATHPGNVREDLDLTAEFCASVAGSGVRIPLLITRDGDDGSFRVIEGHRRLAAAVKAGLAEVPCVLDVTRAGDEAGQLLDMAIANSDSYRRNFTPAEEAAALFAAHEAGATRTRIRRATGRKAEEIKTALQAGGISADTRTQMGAAAGQLTLDQLALLAEFDTDQEAVAAILEALRHGYAVEYVAERIRQDRAEAAEHERLRAELEAAGTQVTTDLPDGAVRLNGLTHDGEDLTPETHGTCPGRGVYFPAWNMLHPVHYCTSPDEHGHVVRDVLLRPPATDSSGTAAPDVLPDPPADYPPDPDRKLVIEGNKAWKATSEVRKRWLASELFVRRTAPREAAPFVARQLLLMPDPLRSGMAGSPSRLLFSEITGRSAASWLEICETTPAARLPLLMLATIVTAYEQAMTEGEEPAGITGTCAHPVRSPCKRHI
jgi:ParB family transcriptional regulator, chromosome partitioning protein